MVDGRRVAALLGGVEIAGPRAKAGPAIEVVQERAVVHGAHDRRAMFEKREQSMELSLRLTRGRG